MIRLIESEALAYLKLGLMLPGRRLARGNGARSEFGVTFVPGVGATEAHFIHLAHALRDEAESFDVFDYSSLRHPRQIADALHEHLEAISERCARFLLIGHSLGGVLARMVLQRERPAKGIAGLVSICAPLHGTWRSKLAPHPGLRSLAPDGALVEEMLAGAHRLERWKGSILTIGSRYDQFISPYDSAFLDGHDRLELEDVAHNGTLFDARVHDAIVGLARRASVR